MHSTEWHKSPMSYDGDNPDVSFFWKLVVRVGLALKRRMPTYWKGIYFVSFRFVSFRFVSFFYFVLFCFVLFCFVLFYYILFHLLFRNNLSVPSGDFSGEAAIKEDTDMFWDHYTKHALGVWHLLDLNDSFLSFLFFSFLFFSFLFFSFLFFSFFISRFNHKQ